MTKAKIENANFNATTARILISCKVDGVEYKPNNLVSASEEKIQSIVESGIACNKESSISYCLKNGVEVVPHKKVLTKEPEKQCGIESDEGELSE